MKKNPLSRLFSLVSLRWWNAPAKKNLTRTIALMVTMTFLLPYVTFAFEGAAYPLPANALLFKNQNIQIPEKIAATKSTFNGGNKLVIHIQDLHCNYEVQSNISAIISQMVKQGLVNMVAIEGASLPVNVTPISTFPNERVKQEAGKHYMRQGLIGGAEFFAATSKQPVLLAGIEKKELYDESLALVRGFLDDEMQGYLYDVKEMLFGLNAKLYTPELKRLDDISQAFQRGEMAQLKFYIYLLGRAKQAGMDLQAYPQMQKFVSKQQNVLAQDIDSDRLFSEGRALEQMLRNQIYTDPRQKAFDEWKQRLGIMEKLLNISVSTEELAVYRANPSAFRVDPIVAFYRQQGGEAEVAADAYQLNAALERVLRFYELADQRSVSFVENTLLRMEEQKTDCTVLITGGFHTEKVLNDLKAKNISYISLVPRISQEDLLNPYFALIRGRKTPLEKLLMQNQTIFAKAPHLPQSINGLAVLSAEEQADLPRDGKVFLDVNRVVLQLTDVIVALSEGRTQTQEIKVECQNDMKGFPYASQLVIDWDNAEAAGKDTFVLPFKGMKGVAVVTVRGDPYGLRALRLEGMGFDFGRFEVNVLDTATMNSVRARVLSAGRQVRGLEVREILMQVLAQNPVLASGTVAMDLARQKSPAQWLSQVVVSLQRLGRMFAARAMARAISDGVRFYARRQLVARVLAYALILAPMPAVLLTGCSEDPVGPEIEEVLPSQYFKSDKLDIRKKTDGTYLIKFTDTTGKVQEVTAKDSSKDQVLFNQDSMQVILTADGKVILIEPYTSTLGTGTSTYTVRADQTVIQQMQVGQTVDFLFQFFDKTTGAVQYSATFAEEGGVLYAVFTDKNNQPLGKVKVTVKVNENTSQTLTFSNDYGTGAKTITVERPTVYVDVASVMASLPQVKIYIKTDGTYIIDYYNVSGTLVKHSEATPSNKDQVLYNENSIQITLKADGAVAIQEPYTNAQNQTGTSTTTIQKDNTVIQLLQVGQTTDFLFTFTNKTTGAAEYTARLVAENGGLSAVFVDKAGVELGRVTVTVTVHANTSQTLTFANDHGIGAKQITVEKPTVYPDVASVMTALPQIKIYLKTNGAYVIDYYGKGTTVVNHSEAVLTSSDQTLYDQGGIKLVLKADGSVVIQEPYTNAQNQTGTSTTTVQKDNTVIQLLQVGQTTDFLFTFTNKTTGAAEYTARLEEKNGILNAVFVDKAGVELGRVTVTVTVHANTSQTLTFANDHGIGAKQITVEKPTLYPDVASVMTALPQIKIYLKTNGGYIVDYYGTGTTVVNHSEAMPSGSDQTLYDQGGIKLVLKADGTVQITEPYQTTGTSTTTLRKDNTVIQMLMVGQTADFRFTFTNKTTGAVDYTASLVDVGGTLYAVFKNPQGTEIDRQVVSVTTNADTTQTLTFANTQGSGATQISVDRLGVYPDVASTLISLTQIRIFAKTNGAYIIDYYSAGGTLLYHGEKAYTSTDQTLYDQAGVVIVLKSDGTVQITEPYTNAQGKSGTSVTTVRKDKTVVQVLRVGNAFEYNFVFANATTGLKEFTGQMVDMNGTPSVQFKNLKNELVAEKDVTVAYHANTSQTLTFQNPTGSGATTVVVEQPAIYADVTATLASISNLKVYQKAANQFIVDYLNATGDILFHTDAATSTTEQTLYNQGGVSIILKTDGQIYFSEAIADGTRTQVIHPLGMVVEGQITSTSKTYSVFFVEQISGQLKYRADVVQKADLSWEAQFAAPINAAVPVTVATDFSNNSTYNFSYDNAAGKGKAQFGTDTTGAITSTGLVHLFQAILGYATTVLTGLFSVGFLGLAYAMGIANPDPGIILAVLSILSVLVSGYLAIGFVKFLEMSSAVRRAMLETQREELWNESNDRKHESYEAFRADASAYAAWVDGLTMGQRVSMWFVSLFRPIAKNDGFRDPLGMKWLGVFSKPAVDWVEKHESQKNDFMGMAVLLPTVSELAKGAKKIISSLHIRPQAIRRILIAKLVVLLMLFAPLSTLVLTGCGSGEGPGIINPIVTKEYFHSDRIDIVDSEGVLDIRFKNALGQTMQLNGAFNGANQILYNQDGIQLVLTSNRLVQLITPYSGTLGTGTSTYSVREDKTAIETIQVGQKTDYTFYFANASNGQVDYTARLVDVAGELKAEFSRSGLVIGQQPVTITYHADTSKTLTFDNTYGSGATHISVDQPVIYADVNATLASMDVLKVYKKTDGSVIVDYLNAAGEVISHSVNAVPAANQTLYENGGVKIILSTAGDVYLTEPITGGTRTRAVSATGMVVDQSLIAGTGTYSTYFVNKNSGLLHFRADIVQIGGVWKAQFAAPVNAIEDVTLSTDFSGNTTYKYDFDNDAGKGTVQFGVDSEGKFISTTLVGTITALLQYAGMIVFGLISAGLASYVLGTGVDIKAPLVGMMLFLPGAGWLVNQVKHWAQSLSIRPKAARTSLLARLLSLLIIFAPLSTLVLTSCGKGEGPGIVVPVEENVEVFHSERVDIEQQPNGTLLISFTDAANHIVDVSGVFNGTNQILYNQGGMQLILTANRQVQLIAPYTGTLGTGTSTYSVREDKTAIEVIQIGQTSNYMFYFANATTAEVEYTAQFVEVAGVLKVEFKNMSNVVIAQNDVTVTYHADTSRTLSFTNPTGVGAALITLEEPAIYPDVNATWASMDQLKVYKKTDGSLIVDYLNTAGEIVSHSVVAIPATDQTLYTSGTVTVVLKSTGEVFWTDIASGNISTYVVNPKGMVVQQATIGGTTTHSVHFVDQISGQLKYRADIVQVSGSWYAQFAAPINQQVAVLYSTDFSGNITYKFDYDNAAGKGTAQFMTDASGNITATMMSHFFRALLGFASAALSGLVGATLLWAGFTLGFGTPEPTMALLALAGGLSLIGGYLTVGAAKYWVMGRFVRQAMRETILEERWQFSPDKKHATYEELRADKTAYAAWIASIPLGQRLVISLASLIRPIASKANGFDALGKKWLTAFAPTALNWVETHEKQSNDIKGMLILLPGAPLLAQWVQGTTTLSNRLLERIFARPLEQPEARKASTAQTTERDETTTEMNRFLEVLPDAPNAPWRGNSFWPVRLIQYGIRSILFATDTRQLGNTALQAPARFLGALFMAGFMLVQVAMAATNTGQTFTAEKAFDDQTPRFQNLKRAFALPSAEDAKNFSVKGVRLQPLSQKANVMQRMFTNQLLGGYAETSRAGVAGEATTVNEAVIYLPDALLQRMSQPIPSANGTLRNTLARFRYKIDAFQFGIIVGYQSRKYFADNRLNLWNLGRSTPSMSELVTETEGVSLTNLQGGMTAAELAAMRQQNVAYNPAELTGLISEYLNEAKQQTETLGIDQSLAAVQATFVREMARGEEPKLAALMQVLANTPNLASGSLAAVLQKMINESKSFTPAQRQLVYNSVLSRLITGSVSPQDTNPQRSIAKVADQGVRVHVISLPAAYSEQLLAVRAALIALEGNASRMPGLVQRLRMVEQVLISAKGSAGSLIPLETTLGVQLKSELDRLAQRQEANVLTLGEGLADKVHAVHLGRMSSQQINGMSMANPLVYEISAPVEKAITVQDVSQATLPEKVVAKLYTGQIIQQMDAPENPIQFWMNLAPVVSHARVHRLALHENPMAYLRWVTNNLKVASPSLRALLQQPNSPVVQAYLRFAASPNNAKAEREFIKSLLMVLKYEGCNATTPIAQENFDLSMAMFSELVGAMRALTPSEIAGVWTLQANKRVAGKAIHVPGILQLIGGKGALGAYQDLLQKTPAKVDDNAFEMQRRRLFMSTSVAA